LANQIAAIHQHFQQIIKLVKVGESFIFLPTRLAHDFPVVDIADIENPQATTVLVPKRPEALEVIGEEAFKMAHKEKIQLSNISEWIARRPFLTTILPTMTCLYRTKLAEIRTKQLFIYKSMEGSSTGKVISRGTDGDPNRATIHDKNPHWEATKKHCLASTCTWSEGYKKQRSDESKARSCVNGQVKTWICLKLLNNFARDDEELQNVTNQMGQYHPKLAILSYGPIVLNYLHGKIQLLIKHIISPNYENWDLDLDFSQDGWTVFMVGFLYSREYEDINKIIAKCGLSQQEIQNSVIGFPKLLPTVSLNHQIVAKKYDISEERAKTICDLAKYYQIRSPDQIADQPLSLVTMLTPDNIDSNINEKHLRGRAAQMSGMGEIIAIGDTERAILEISRCLAIDDLQIEDVSSGILSYIKRHIYLSDYLSVNEKEVIIKYHLLLWKAAGSDKWTHERHSGEANVIPYLPLLIEATKSHMSAETCLNGEYLPYIDSSLRDDISSNIDCPENWAEIGILEFIKGTIPKNKVPAVDGPTSQATVQIITSDHKKIPFRKSTDRDVEIGEEQFLNKDNRAYIRTGKNVRKLYEYRPSTLENITLGQFATQYYVMNKSRKTQYEALNENIDNASNMGPDSKDYIVGVPGIAAPQSMMLKNGELMKKRTRGPSTIPHLLYTGAMGQHGYRLMFRPWRELEQVNATDQTELETESQREIRLAIFPMGVFSSFFQLGMEEDD
jgi:hypothetical protein